MQKRDDKGQNPQAKIRKNRFSAALLLGGFFSSSLLMTVITTTASAQVPPGETPILREMGAKASPERLRLDVEKLVSFGTRHSLSETQSETRGIGAARRWIEEEFNRISKACGNCLEVITVADTVSGERRIPDPTEIVNVIAIQRGTLDPDRMVIMSGDIDSRVSDPMNATADSPGANDNATGVAGTIEAARVLSQYRFPGTIVYAALSGEEQGLFGGQILAEYALKQGWKVKAVINNDMIGNISGINGVIDNSTARVFSEGTRATETPEEARIRRFSGGEVDSASRNLARYIDRLADDYIPNLDVMMVYRLDRFGRGGHHRPFNDVGMPGVRIMETNEDYTRQHQDLRRENGIDYGDVIAGVDFAYNAKLTALNVVTLAALASAPPFPSDVKIAGAVEPSTKLSWTRPTGKEAENLAGYRVYWRLTTDPQWTFSRWVGDSDQVTLENIVIDNYYFGVASVSKDGFESPVVFPGPAGSFDHGIATEAE
ncbi:MULTISPECIES: M28 family metallopeptidase [unclassified Iodidimonas]|jgi:hypothetical protein|uniref:M28 family peptidase n=1 Tax=unclassified Iodidimonas TaxID=2626145 RepID=UPI002482EB35|nr:MULTISPECIES: M28 family metallopeptidase [unclassified Iodidimonas]